MITTAEIIHRIATNQINYLRATNEIKRRGELTAEIDQQIQDAINTAAAARQAADGYKND
jgi:hypothetical protein